MRKYVIILMTVVSGCLANLSAQTAVIIGTGTTSSTIYGPIYRISSTSTVDYSRYQYLYLASELASIPTGAMITEIAWNKSSSFITNPPATFQIYLRNSTAATLVSGSTWASITSGSTLVYSNTNQIISSSTGWIPFSITPFVYTGQNLEVAVDWDISVPTVPSTGPINWNSTSVGTGRVIGATGTTTPPTTLTSSYTFRPNIRFTYILPSYPDMAAINVTPITPIIGLNTVQVTLANYGNTNLNGVPVSLSYSTDGGVTWTAPESFTPTTLSTIGSTQTYTFTTPWNITTGGTYTLCARINPPGVLGDGVPTNDQFCRSVCTGYSGTYTVGGISPHFATLNDAIAALLSCGIVGHVTLNIRPGTYTQQVNIPPISGLSATNTLVIQSETGDSTSVTLTFSSSSSTDYHTIRFNGGSFITLRKLTIEGTGTYTRTIEFNSNSNNITITNCRIYAPITTSSLQNPIYANTTAPNNNITIQNNLISGGYYGVYARFGTATSISSLANYIIIRNNIIRDFYYYGIYGYYLNGIDISKNYISGAGSSTTFQYGIYLGYCGASLAGLIEKNYIVNLGAYGIYMFSTSGASTFAPLNVRNNIVAGFRSSSTVYGIYSSSGNFINYYFNSVRLNNGNSTLTAALYITSGSNINVVNNILSYNGTGAGYSLYKSTSASVTNCNFNCYYSAGPSLAFWNSAVTNLTALQTASGMNNNSIQHNASFISDTVLRTQDAAIYKAGISITGIVDDFDENPRFSPPSIGAVEISPYDLKATSAVANPLPILVNTSNTILFTITNTRDMPFTNPNVYFKRKGMSTPIASEIASTTLISSSSYTHTFATPYIPTSIGNDTLLLWLSHPDDKHKLNDTIIYTFRVHYLDLALTEMIGPGTNVLEGSSNTVTVKVKNNSTYKVANFPISYRVNTLPPITSLHSDTINPGQTNIYSFTTSYTPATMGTDIITIYLGNTREQNRLNDTIRNNITVDRKDVAITTLVNPPTTPTVLPIFSQHVVKVYLRNLGSLPMSLSQVTYQEVGKPPVTEVYTGTVFPNDSVLFSFATLYMPTSAGTKTFKLWVKTSGDMLVSNDTLIRTIVVGAANPIDVKPSSLHSPKFITAGNNTIAAYIKNLGLTQLDSVTIAYKVDSGPAVVERLTGTVSVGDSILYIFSTPANITSTSAQICVFTSNPNGITDAQTYNDTLCKIVQINTLNEHTIQEVPEWQIYPNPVCNTLNIQLISNTTQKVTIELLDLLGKKLHVDNYTVGQGVYVISKDTNLLPNGTYILQLTTTNETKQKKILIYR
ncbi:MAG: T9SS type A sorting domain-containing protein [Bacteroidia bacterium]|nr:T9SS type A sorting domain-containing protein [Bacteroidia bacterium]MDW8346201.1 T9SS type A sorting domain-containing protein [Bacteroidia bacterium]